MSIDVIIDHERETMWATQKTMADLFNVSKQNISYHLSDVFKTGELEKIQLSKKF